MRKTKELIRMRGFTEAEREQIKEWLEDHTYAETTELIQTEYQREVPAKTLERYYHRNAPLRELEAKAELGEAAIAFLRHAVEGSAAFEPAAIEAVKQHAFKLAMTKEDFGQLKLCFQIIHGDTRLALHSRRLDLEERRIILKEPPLPRVKDPTEVHEKRWDEWGMPQANRAFFRKEILDEMARLQAIRNLGHNPNPAHKIPPVGRVARPGVPQSGPSDPASSSSPSGRADAPSASEAASAVEAAASSEQLEQSAIANQKSKIQEEPWKCPIDALWFECGENKEKFLEAFKSKDCAPTYIITHIDSDDWPQEKREAIKEARQWQDVRLRQKSDERHARYVRERSSQCSNSDLSSGLPIPHPESVNPPSEPGGFNLNSRGLSPRNPRSRDETNSTPDGVQQSAPDKPAESVDHPATSHACLTIDSKRPHDARLSHQGEESPVSPKTNVQPETNVSLSLPKGEGQGEGSPQSQIKNLKSKTNNALAYTHARAEEYCAYRQSITPWPYREYPPRYKTKLIQCPCGSQLPCPHHEEFTVSFWSLSPFSPDYMQALLHRNLPIPENLQSYAA